MGRARGRFPRGLLYDLHDLGRQNEGWPPRAFRVLLDAAPTLLFESTQPAAHRLADHSQLFGNLLHGIPRRVQQQHLGPLHQSRRQRLAARKALKVIFLLLAQSYSVGSLHAIPLTAAHRKNRHGLKLA